MENKIKLFEDKKVRLSWNDEEQDWYFSIADIVVVLNECDYLTGRKYWNKLKQRLKEDGNETVTCCNQLKLPASLTNYKIILIDLCCHVQETYLKKL